MEWVKQPTTTRYFSLLGDLLIQYDENTRINLCSDRLHEAKMCAGRAQGVHQAIQTVQYLMPREENDGSQDSSA